VPRQNGALRIGSTCYKDQASRCAGRANRGGGHLSANLSRSAFWHLALAPACRHQQSGAAAGNIGLRHAGNASMVYVQRRCGVNIDATQRVLPFSVGRSRVMSLKGCATTFNGLWTGITSTVPKNFGMYCRDCTVIANARHQRIRQRRAAKT
jgi:hypothetical protein